MEDVHAVWGHRWLTPKAKVRESSIHGLGVYANEPIGKDEVICVFGGVIVPVSEMPKYREKVGPYGIQIDDDFCICPTSREELKKDGLFNHSCNPNRGFKDSLVTTAMRDIKLGEEIVTDYAFTGSHFEPFACNCHSADCRKIIGPADWQTKSLQERYGEYFSPFLKRKFLEK